MKAMFIYDDTGKIYHWAQGDFIEPTGLPYLIVEDYDFDERPVERIDTSVNPPVPVYGMTREEARRASMTLEEYKEEKIILSKTSLEQFLLEHPITSSAHGGVEGVYAITSEKQNLMMSNYMTYQIESQVNPEAVLTWNETGKSCEEWKPEEFLQLILEIKTFVKPRISLQQKYEELIMEATSKDDVDMIILSYEDCNITTSENTV